MEVLHRFAEARLTSATGGDELLERQAAVELWQHVLLAA
jgi:hypothetical protein